jgi:hypothetical protein
MSGFPTGGLAKPRRRKQKARAFLRWRRESNGQQYLRVVSATAKHPVKLPRQHLSRSSGRCPRDVQTNARKCDPGAHGLHTHDSAATSRRIQEFGYFGPRKFPLSGLFHE